MAAEKSQDLRQISQRLLKSRFVAWDVANRLSGEIVIGDLEIPNKLDTPEYSGPGYADLRYELLRRIGEEEGLDPDDPMERLAIETHPDVEHFMQAVSRTTARNIAELLAEGLGQDR